MGLSFVTEPVSVSTPATSANLGPGFDALGLALTLYDDLTARVTTGGFTVTVTGEGAGDLPDGADHLVIRAMLTTFDEAGARPPGIALECVNRIPQARGLGSSSAAIVGGVQLARGLITNGHDLIDDEAALRIAARIEGHPDNVAPCLLGGFTVAWTEESGARAVKLAPAPSVRPMVFIPSEVGYTASARAALPSEVPHRDAAFNAGRAALLTHALTRDPSLLMPATEDRLHQGYRAAGMPATAALVASLRSAGVAAMVSGAGPTVLALTQVPADFDPGAHWRGEVLGVDDAGACVKGGMVEHAERGPVAAGRTS